MVIHRRVASLFLLVMSLFSLEGIAAEIRIAEVSAAPGAVIDAPLLLHATGTVKQIDVEILFDAGLDVSNARPIRTDHQGKVSWTSWRLDRGLALSIVLSEPLESGVLLHIPLETLPFAEEKPYAIRLRNIRTEDFQGRPMTTTGYDGAVQIQATGESRRRAVVPRIPDRAPSTRQNLEKARKEGRIDEETALLYALYDAFDDPRLPGEFKGDNSLVSETNIADEVARRFDSLSPAMQDKVEPFLLPPFHRGSWADPDRSLGKTRVLFSGACGDVDFQRWDYLDNTDATIRVWWQRKFDATDRPKAKEIVAQIDGTILVALKKLTNRLPPRDEPGLCRGVTDALDIALIDGRSQTKAYLKCVSFRVRTSYILLDRGKPSPTLIPTAAHELMHAIQLTFLPENCLSALEYRWLMEATAQWVMDYIYPQGPYGNAEQEFTHPGFLLQDPEKPLDFLPGNDDFHAYSAYLFPFFLARAFKNKTWQDTDFAQRAFANASMPNSLDAVQSALGPRGGFKKVWPQFVLQNWNRDPVDDYRSQDQIQYGARTKPGSSQIPPPDKTVDAALNGQGFDVIPFPIALEHLSAEYHHILFPAEDSRTVVFYNGLAFKLSKKPTETNKEVEVYATEPAPQDEKKGASIQALLKIGGKWLPPEDWTDKPYVSFCRDAQDERLEELVLIFANWDHERGRTLRHQGDIPPKLVFNNIGCWGWEGKTSSVDDNGVTRTEGKAKVKFIRAYWPSRVEPPPLTTQYGGGVTFTGSGTVEWTFDDRTCPFQTGGSFSISQGMSSLQAVLTTWNFSVGGSWYRGATGLGQDPSQKITYKCGEVPVGSWFYIPPPAGGKTETVQQNGLLKGELTDGDTTYKWDLHPIRE